MIISYELLKNSTKGNLTGEIFSQFFDPFYWKKKNLDSIIIKITRLPIDCASSIFLKISRLILILILERDAILEFFYSKTLKHGQLIWNH